MTGNGKPEIDWMRFAKIRSTRSKLRSYFRRKQRQSLRDAGEILLDDFLTMYGDIIQESSFLEEPFEIPSSVEDLSQFLPGKTNYQDVDDLLIEIGSNHDRNTLRTAIAKIFLVPQKILVNAESNRSQILSSQMLDVVNAKRQSALDVSFALGEEDELFDGDIEISQEDGNGVDKVTNEGARELVNGTNGSPPSQIMSQRLHRPSETSINGSHMPTNGLVEIANSKKVCPACLPVFGDDIIGTRPPGMDANDFVTTVHRCDCGIVLQAKNQINAKQGEAQSSKGSNLRKNGRKLKSSFKSRLKPFLTGLNQYGYSNMDNSDQSSIEDKRSPKSQSTELVDIVWDDSPEVGEKVLYLTQISLICNDRKLLLADVSEVVSDMSEIVKTGSLSSEDKATAVLNFLVKVESLDHLQKLMYSLSEIESVMSVERHVSANGLKKHLVPHVCLLFDLCLSLSLSLLLKYSVSQLGSDL